MSCRVRDAPASLRASAGVAAWVMPARSTPAARPGSARLFQTRGDPSWPLLLPDADEVGRYRERGYEGEGVVEHGVGVVGGNAGDGVPWDHDLVAVVHGVEGQVLDGDVHRHTHGDDGRHAHVAQHGIEAGAA